MIFRSVFPSILLCQAVFLKLKASTYAVSTSAASTNYDVISYPTDLPNKLKTNLNIEKLQSTIASGRVYQHENFINETRVQAMLDDIERIRKDNIMKPSGLSNTLKKQNQNFGEEDRTAAPAPWWKESLQHKEKL